MTTENRDAKLVRDLLDRYNEHMNDDTERKFKGAEEWFLKKHKKHWADCLTKEDKLKGMSR